MTIGVIFVVENVKVCSQQIFFNLGVKCEKNMLGKFGMELEIKPCVSSIPCDNRVICGHV
jgi:hypothetical protein